ARRVWRRKRNGDKRAELLETRISLKDTNSRGSLHEFVRVREIRVWPVPNPFSKRCDRGAGRAPLTSNLEIAARASAVPFAHHLHRDTSKQHEGLGGYVASQNHIPSNGAALADDRFSPQDGGAGINGDAVFQGRMAFLAAELFHRRGGFGSQSHAVIHLHAVADFARLPYDRAGAVIDKKMRPTSCARMQVHTSASVRPFRHDAWD